MPLISGFFVKMDSMKAFKIITFGCRVNQAESRMMGEKLVELGLTQKCAMAKKCVKTDIVIINTCCVTQKAEREVRKEIRRVKRENPDCFLVVAGCWVERFSAEVDTNFCSVFKSPAKQSCLAIKSAAQCCKHKNTHKNCISPRYKYKELFKKIDLLIGNKEKEKIAQILKEKIFINAKRSPTNNKKYEDKYVQFKKALIKIQEGCDKFCSYCIVPFVRGRSKSRPAEEIIGEIKQKVKEGIEEVVLTGIDIGSYKFKFSNFNFQFSNKLKIQKSTPASREEKFKNDLVKLIRLILKETKIKKISFGSLSWEVFDEELIGLYQREALLRLLDNRAEVAYQDFCVHKSPAKKLNLLLNSSAQGCKHVHSKNLTGSPRARAINSQQLTINRLTSHFHIPLQSGCNTTLKRMNRKYTIKNCKLKIENLKKAIPNFTFSTDIIVGFPGETKREFEETVRVIRTIKEILGKKFTHIHIFRYSSRPGTLAAKMEEKWGKVDEKEKRRRAKIIKLIVDLRGY